MCDDDLRRPGPAGCGRGFGEGLRAGDPGDADGHGFDPRGQEVTEWCLFDPGQPPRVADPALLSGQPWMSLAGQPGFVERAELVKSLFTYVDGANKMSVSDLGCGDGTMLRI